MEAATTEHSERARWTRDMCPAWSAPMVGTKPSEDVVVRKSRQICCISFTVSMRRMLFAGLLIFQSHEGSGFAGEVIALGVGGEGAGFHVAAILFQRGLREAGHVGVTADKFGWFG